MADEIFFGNEKNHWFALYRDDDVIDDHTSINNIKRGHFRLHPIGSACISQGCITLISKIGFDELKAVLRQSSAQVITGTGILYYGVIEVR
ncbi:MAG: tlde1 domain-containing protein [Pseudomonas sp.]